MTRYTAPVSILELDAVGAYNLTPKGLDCVEALKAFEEEWQSSTDGEELRPEIKQVCWAWFYSGWQSRRAADPIEAGDIA